MRPTIGTQLFAKSQIYRIIQSIPCPACRDHAIKYLAENPVRVKTSYEFQVWAWRFHNDVNIREKKRFMTFLQYMQMYLPMDQLIYVSIASAM